MLKDSKEIPSSSISTVIQDWYHDLQKLHTLLADGVNQRFLLRYNPAHSSHSKAQFFQRLCCIMIYHFPSTREVIARGDVALFYLNRLFYTATSSASLSGILTACCQPQLICYSLPKIPVPTEYCYGPVKNCQDKIPDLK